MKGILNRVLYAFDPRRVAILLIGGNKSRCEDWYAKTIQIAESLYDEHLSELIEEGLL